MGVLEGLGGELEGLCEFLVGGVAVVQLVVQLLDALQELGDAGFQLLLLGLRHLRILFVLLQQPMYLLIV